MIVAHLVGYTTNGLAPSSTGKKGNSLWFNRMRFGLVHRIKHALHVSPLVAIHVRLAKQCRWTMLRESTSQAVDQSDPSSGRGETYRL